MWTTREIPHNSGPSFIANSPVIVGKHGDGEVLFQSVQSVQFVTPMLCATRRYSSCLYPQINSALSISRPALYAAPCCGDGLSSTLQTCKPSEGPLCPVSHCITNTFPLANDVGHGAVVVAPRTHTSSSRNTSLSSPHAFMSTLR